MTFHALARHGERDANFKPILEQTYFTLEKLHEIYIPGHAHGRIETTRATLAEAPSIGIRSPANLAAGIPTHCGLERQAKPAAARRATARALDAGARGGHAITCVAGCTMVRTFGNSVMAAWTDRKR
jgi:hypothetical protein